MILLGITGGIGMGKSATATLLERRGIPVVDTDLLAREIAGPGEPALADIVRAFGPEVIGPDGHLRRDLMAQLVFPDLAARKQLEAILHPRIRERWLAQVEAWRHQGVRCGAVVIPLLFENRAESNFDFILCVACSPESQRQRLKGRGWTDEQIAQRLAAQMSTEDKVRRSHFLIWAEGGPDPHECQLQRVLQTLGIR